MAKTEENPIINNRIVNDITFAVRLKKFVSDILCSTQSGKEEQNYILSVANKLIHYQVATLKDPEEKKYLAANNVIRLKKTVEQLKQTFNKLPYPYLLKVTHIKTGNEYAVKGIYINSTNNVDGQEMVAYSPIGDNKVYVREIKEFVSKFDW
jgi:hypothetical protein